MYTDENVKIRDSGLLSAPSAPHVSPARRTMLRRCKPDVHRQCLQTNTPVSFSGLDASDVSALAPAIEITSARTTMFWRSNTVPAKQKSPGRQSGSVFCPEFTRRVKTCSCKIYAPVHRKTLWGPLRTNTEKAPRLSARYRFQFRMQLTCQQLLYKNLRFCSRVDILEIQSAHP